MERNHSTEISTEKKTLLSWNLRNCEIWFILVTREIYAHTVYVWIYVRRLSSRARADSTASAVPALRY